jgi:nucleotide-binding universal stress UspA family protein
MNTMIALKRILVPHDFSETSNDAVKYAVALGRTFGAKLYVLHVSEKAQADMATEFPLGLDASMEDAVRERLLKIITPAEQKELKPVFEVCAGTPYVEILDYAKDHDADLIVMGMHGRGFVGRVVMGSVAEKVVRYASCPVLTVHSSEHEFVAEETAEQPVRVAV